MQEEESNDISQSNPTDFFESFSIDPELKALYELIDEQDSAVPCTNYPDAFSVEYGDLDFWETVRYAKNLCESCPIRQQCLDYALKNEVWNIWGGTTAAERAVMHGNDRFRPRSMPGTTQRRAS
jgi:hypothetical protein